MWNYTTWNLYTYIKHAYIDIYYASKTLDQLENWKKKYDKIYIKKQLFKDSQDSKCYFKRVFSTSNFRQ